jgi:nitrite reductase (NADH) large subunit
MAAGRVLDEFFVRAPERYDITMFGAEPRVNYDRIMLSPVLAGEKRFEDIIVHNDDWYARDQVDLRRGEIVVAIDRAARTVRTQSGVVERYDALIIAIGSRPILIPVPGVELPGVVTFRDLDDVNAMLAAAQKSGHAVVIGGGLLGLEAAAGLAAKGMKTTVVHLMPTLIERQLDPNAAYLLQKAIEKRGIEILTSANTNAILGDDKVKAVRLEDGRTLPADLVVMAVGIRPHTALAKEAGLEVKRGIVVDDCLRTSDPSIFAVGECVEHRGQCYGLVAPLYDMVRTLAAVLAGEQGPGYAGSAISTKLKVTGIDVFSAGDFSEGDEKDEIVLRDPARGVYKRVVGIVCVESGYDIHIAGAAGLHVRATDLLAHVATEEEAIEYVAAVLQLYREKATYLHRIYKWAELTGIDKIRAAIVDDHDGRRALVERFLKSQRAARKDPWAERAAGRELHEFMPLAVLTPVAPPAIQPATVE